MKKNLLRKSKFNTLVYTAILLFISVHSFATTYYSRTSGANWNVNTTWSTVGYGNATNAGTYPIAGDVVNIGNGYTINISSAVSCATLNIGQGVSGILQFLSTGNYSLTVSGNVTVNTGAKVWYNTATTRTHNCYVGGNFTNNGVVDFYVNATSVVNLRFNTNVNSVISGTGTWDMNIMTMDKTASANTLDVFASNFETGIKNFSANSGTYIHDNTGTYSINPTATSFTIYPNVVVKVPNGTMNIGKSVLILQGKLYVNGGTLNAGSNTGNQGINSDQNGATVPYLEVTSGILNVYGGITYGSVSYAEPFNFKMTGGTINLNIGNSSTYRQLFCITDVTNSVFYMSGGTIVFEKPNGTGSSVIDAAINGTNGTITTLGGTFQFGNSSTANGKTFNFKPFPNGTYPNINITGAVDSVITLRPSASAVADFKMLSLTIDTKKVFDVRSISGTTGDTKKMTLTSTVNGFDALVNNGTFTARKGTVTFATTNTQAISGTDTTTFYNLTVNNANGIILTMPANVSKLLSMVDGVLYTDNTNILTCLVGANADLGTVTSYVDGPMVQTVADTMPTAKTFPLGNNSSWRPVVLTVTHSDTLPVIYTSQMFNTPGSALPISNGAGISNVSDVRYTYFARSNVNNFDSARIQVYYDFDDMVTDYTNLKLVQDDGSGQWVNIGGAATANISGNVVSGSFNFFNNYFALANPVGGNNQLRKASTTFNAELQDKDVVLKWITNSEINTDHFTVERSADNTDFTPIATVPAQGNSVEVNAYSVLDQNAPQGTLYYRLTLYHTDGSEERFASSISGNNAEGNFMVYPTVSDGNNIHVRYPGANLQQYHLTIIDALSRQIPFKTSPALNGIDIHLDYSSVTNGSFYFVCATNGTDNQSRRIQIVR